MLQFTSIIRLANLVLTSVALEELEKRTITGIIQSWSDPQVKTCQSYHHCHLTLISLEPTGFPDFCLSQKFWSSDSVLILLAMITFVRFHLCQGQLMTTCHTLLGTTAGVYFWPCFVSATANFSFGRFHLAFNCAKWNGCFFPWQSLLFVRTRVGVWNGCERLLPFQQQGFSQL